LKLWLPADRQVTLVGEELVPTFAFNTMSTTGKAWLPLAADVLPWTFDRDCELHLSGAAVMSASDMVDPLDILQIALTKGARQYRTIESKISFSQTNSTIEVSIETDNKRPFFIQPISATSICPTETITAKHLRLEIATSLKPLVLPIRNLAVCARGSDDLKGVIWIPWDHLNTLDDDEKDLALRAISRLGDYRTRILTALPDGLQLAGVIAPKNLFPPKKFYIYETDKVDLYHPAHCVSIPIEIVASA
jgi:hypothetical protein